MRADAAAVRPAASSEQANAAPRPVQADPVSDNPAPSGLDVRRRHHRHGHAVRRGRPPRRGRRAGVMKHLLDNGSDGFVVAGTTGEGRRSTDAEKLRLWSSPSPSAASAAVIAGTGSNDTAHTVHLTEQATELGVDAVLVVTPYYNKPNARGLKAHFEADSRRHRQADRPLQHPVALRGRHPERPAGASWPRSRTSRGQAGALRGPRADRGARPARRQRRHARRA